MNDEQLAEWVKRKLKRGEDPEILKKGLMKEGYDTKVVDEVKNLYGSSPESAKHSHLLPLLIVGIISIAALGVGAYFFIFQDKIPEIIHRNVESTVDIKDKGGNKVGELSTKIKADVEVTTNCGGLDCFKQKFAECKPATLNSKLMDNIVYFYEIIGPKEGLCEVKSKFIANPNPKWVGKEMTCRYDNTLDFETAIRDMSKCNGELYNLMTGKS